MVEFSHKHNIADIAGTIVTKHETKQSLLNNYLAPINSNIYFGTPGIVTSSSAPITSFPITSFPITSVPVTSFPVPSALAPSVLVTNLVKSFLSNNVLVPTSNFGNWIVTVDDVNERAYQLKTTTPEFFETISSDTPQENSLNDERIKRFQVEFSTKLLHLVREQEFEYGFYSSADELVRKCLNQNKAVAKQWLNQLFIANYGDQSITIGLLRVIAHLDYNEIAPEGPTMALAALINKNNEIQECGIRAFENWVHPESLNVLKNVKCHEKWLNDYLQQVIADLTDELT